MVMKPNAYFPRRFNVFIKGLKTMDTIETLAPGV